MILIRSTPQSMDAHPSTSGNYYAEDLTEEQNMNNLLLPKFWIIIVMSIFYRVRQDIRPGL